MDESNIPELVMEINELMEKVEMLEKELNETRGQKDFWLRNYSLLVSQHNKEVESIRGQLAVFNDQLLMLIKG